MDILGTLISLLLSLLLLNTVIMIHELGHYVAAAYAGMTAHEVSVGFGRILFSTKDQYGTTWSWRLWPLGGYVDLYGPNAQKQADYFSTLSFFKQSLILFAGILVNLFSAFVVLTLCFTTGFDQKKLIIQDIEPYSPAAEIGLKAGDTLVAVDDIPLENWELTQLRFILFTTSHKERSLSYQRNGTPYHTNFSSANWPLFSSEKTILTTFGIKPLRDPLSLTLSAVQVGGPAAFAGMEIGDTIIAVDDTPVSGVRDLIQIVREMPGETVTITVSRAGELIDIPVQIGVKGWLRTHGILGVRFSQTMSHAELYQYTSYPLHHAALMSITTISAYLVTSFVVLGYLITGKLSLSMLAGPVFIISQTQTIIYYEYFISLLRWFAAINICLAFANLIPLPMLDGGQWLILCIEKILGRPLSNNTKEWLYALCFGFLVALMVTITLQDISRVMRG